MHLVHQTRIDTRFAQHNRRAVSRIQLEALFQQFCRQVHHAFFIAFAHGKQRTTVFLHGGVAAQLRFGKRFSEGAAHAHYFPGRAHFWP